MKPPSAFTSALEIKPPPLTVTILPWVEQVVVDDRAVIEIDDAGGGIRE